MVVKSTLAKSTLLVSMLFLAQNALALSAGVFSGGGEYKQNDGETGTYQQTLTISQTDSGLQFDDATTIESPEGPITMTQSYAATDLGNGFYSLAGSNDSGELTGTGYCFDTVCHLQYSQTDGGVSEETWQIQGNQINLIGSHKGEMEGTPFFVAWRGTLTLQ